MSCIMNTMILIRALHHDQHKYYIHFSATGYIETLRGLFPLHAPSNLHFFLGRILNYSHTIILYFQSAQKLYSKFRGINSDISIFKFSCFVCIKYSGMHWPFMYEMFMDTVSGQISLTRVVR